MSLCPPSSVHLRADRHLKPDFVEGAGEDARGWPEPPSATLPAQAASHAHVPPTVGRRCGGDEQFRLLMRGRKEQQIHF